jgi:hypothetical protein
MKMTLGIVKNHGVTTPQKARSDTALHFLCKRARIVCSIVQRVGNRLAILDLQDLGEHLRWLEASSHESGRASKQAADAHVDHLARPYQVEHR